MKTKKQNIIQDRGSINIEPYVDSRGMRWRGETIGDMDKLRWCGCPRYFSEADYDGVLKKASEMGYDLSAPLDHPAYSVPTDF